MFTVETNVRLPAPIEEVWPFFSNARNLERLTPAFLKFVVMTPEPIEMRVGTLIDYKLRLRGVPVRWQSEITVWEPPYRFTDEQRRGPYRSWHHEHRFESDGEGTIASDLVRYDHVGSRLANWLLVGRDVRNIFAYRRKVLEEVFSGPDRGSS